MRALPRASARALLATTVVLLAVVGWVTFADGQNGADTDEAAIVATPDPSPDAPGARDVAAASERPTDGSTPATPAPRVRRGTGEDPLRVAIAGDSVAVTFVTTVEWALRTLGEGAVGPFELSNGAALGFGLASDLPYSHDGARHEPRFADWRARFRDWLRDTRPDVVVAMFGTWDVVPVEVDGRWFDPTSPGWAPWYRARLEELVAMIDEAGARPMLATEPCLEIDNEAGPVNAVMRDLASSDEVALLDLDAALCRQGELSVPWADELPAEALALLRPDGVHFDQLVAPAVLAEFVAEHFAADWNLAPA